MMNPTATVVAVPRPIAKKMKPVVSKFIIPYLITLTALNFES